MEDILFPHEKIRESQKLFIEDVQDALKEKKNLLAHAPTGIGKTSILGPVLSFALKNNLTVFFLTSRHTQHKIAIETLKKIREKYDKKIKVLDLIGRQGVCLQPGAELMYGNQFSEFCHDLIEKRTCEFYNNVNDKNAELKVLLEDTKYQPLHVEELVDMSHKCRLCPYEVGLLKAIEANVIIGDYYHVFNPSIRELFFKKAKKELKRSIIIVDEAHNLPGRIRELMSAKLTNGMIDRALKESENYDKVNGYLIEIKNMLVHLKEGVREERFVNKKEFYLENYDEVLEEMEKVAEEVRDAKKRSYVSGVMHFLEAWLGEDDGFARILSRSFVNNKEVLSLSYRCLDPSLVSKDIIDEAYCVLGMSGTLNPIDMYSDLLGMKCMKREYDNPFPKENRMNIVIPDTTTKFTARGEEMYKRIADYCAKMIDLVPGNVALFFPSYYLMENVDFFLQNKISKSSFKERSGLSKQERDEMLEKFKGYKDRGAVLLGVSSGSFGEGVDLPGDFLKAVVVVGLPLSKPDLETKRLIEYYDDKFSKGWDYAYIFPAMIRVIQSAGRCIRSEDDKGVIIFLDERYSYENYSRCFPKDWDVHFTKMPEKRVKEFFS